MDLRMKVTLVEVLGLILVILSTGFVGALDNYRGIGGYWATEQRTSPISEGDNNPNGSEFYSVNTDEPNRQESVNQAALFFFSEWTKRWRDYSVDYSMSLEKPPRVDASVSRLFYRDYMENNNIDSLNKAKDIISKQTNLYYRNYDEWKDVWGVENEFGELLFSFREMKNELSSETCQRIRTITARMADYWSDTNKVRSGYQGDTKAEENAWTARFLALAANLFPEEPNAVRWEKYARMFAYHTITTSTDRAYGGIRTQTIHDHFVLDNHGYHPNPMYALWTLRFLGQGAAAYLENDKAVPWEFKHNTKLLWEKTKTHIRLGRDEWIDTYQATDQGYIWDPSWVIPMVWPWLYLVCDSDPDYGDKVVSWRYKHKPWLGKQNVERFDIDATAVAYVYILNSTIREYAESFIERQEGTEDEKASTSIA